MRRPGAFAGPEARRRAHAQNHYHKDEKDHDGPCINDHLQGRGKGRAQEQEDEGRREEGDDKIKEGMNGILPGHGHEGGDDGN
jgi:hypothetical protein